MKLVVIRHGTTAGNRRHAYVGASDEPLDEDGVQAAFQAKPQLLAEIAELYPTLPSRIYTSPLQRATQTAEILFPDIPHLAVAELAEFDFGAFEGKNYEDLENDVRYRAWVDANCEPACPQGDSRESYILRTIAGAEKAVASAVEAGDELCIIVAHGGTVMALFSALSDSGRSYFDWQPPNCGGAYGAIMFDEVNNPDHQAFHLHDCAILPPRV